MRNLGTVILAAGLSSRMGAFKPLLPLAGTGVLQRVVDLVSGCGQIVVVTGHRADSVGAEAERLGVRTVFNPDFSQGMFTSVCTGVRALETGLDGFFMLPVDIALVRSWTLQRLVEKFSMHRPLVAFPTFDGERGHPPLIHASVIPAILQHDGRGGLRRVLETMDGRMLDVPTFDRNILLDMDTPEAFEIACQRAKKIGIPDRGEAEALLACFDLSAMGVAHGRKVAEVAVALAQALNARGFALDEDLVYAAALVHDLAKGMPKHEREGGRILESMGLPEMAGIVAAHRDVAPPADGRPTEKAVVCLADKLVRGPQRISVSQRFDEKLATYASDPDACAAIRGRKKNALALLEMVQDITEKDVESILAAKGLGR